MKRILLLSLLLLPSFAMAQDYLRKFPLQRQTTYFEFHYQRHPERIGEIARFADAFVRLVNRDFFRADFDYPIRVLVLEDRNTFQNFLRREFRMADPPNFGVYLGPPHKLFATFEDSGLGTFAHEIMHPLVERNLPDRPVWAMEGIPGFFEKFYGYWQGNELRVSWGYHNPWRLEALGTNLVRLDLKAILASRESQTAYGQSDLRMVVMFLWEQGKFNRFLRLIEAREKKGYPSYFEAAMEMPIERVLPLWQQYLKDVEARKRELVLLPASSVVANEQLFRPLRIVHGLRMPAPPTAPAPKAR